MSARAGSLPESFSTDGSAEPNWPDALTQLLAGNDLPSAHVAWVMEQIMAGNAAEAQIAGFAIALRAKGEAAHELSALTSVMLAHAATLPGLPTDTRFVDVVGTGGDRANTVNISTMAAVVVAASGVPVVKHGNRAASSQCGSADLLAELGITVDLDPASVVHCVQKAGIGFCFAPRFHQGMRHAVAARRALGVPTVFNFLGPLTNPARPRALAVGCADVAMAPLMAQVLADRGDDALVLRGNDGLDEFTTTSPTRVWLADGNSHVVQEMVVDATDLGLARARPEQLRGGDASHNAAVAQATFAGETGPVADAVALNAAAALVAHNGLTTIDTDKDLLRALSEKLSLAQETLRSGRASKTLNAWIAAASRH